MLVAQYQHNPIGLVLYMGRMFGAAMRELPDWRPEELDRRFLGWLEQPGEWPGTAPPWGARDGRHRVPSVPGDARW